MARLEYVFWEVGDEPRALVAEPMMQWPLVPGAMLATASVNFPGDSTVLEAITTLDDIEREADPEGMTTLDKIATQIFNEGVTYGRREAK